MLNSFTIHYFARHCHCLVCVIIVLIIVIIIISITTIWIRSMKSGSLEVARGKCEDVSTP